MVTWSGNILILLISITAAASRYLADEELSPEERKQIQQLLQQLYTPQEYHDHRHDDHLDDHNFRNIQTYNHMFKQSNIAGLSPNKLTSSSTSKEQGLFNFLCKAGGECGKNCGEKCSQDDSLYLHHDHEDNDPKQNDDKLLQELLKGISKMDDDSSDNDAVGVKKLLDELEKVLILDYGNAEKDVKKYFKAKCEDDVCDFVNTADTDVYDSKSRDDGTVVAFLNNIENKLVKDNVEQLSCKGLRCGCSGGRCGCNSVRCGCNGDRCELEDNQDDDNKENLNYRSKGAVIKGLDKAKIYKINDELDALVIDVSDADELLELLGSNDFVSKYDKDSERTEKSSNSKRLKGVPGHTYKRQLPMSMKQPNLKLNRNKKLLFRRSASQDPESYGLPFELEVEGLGQVNS